ncbi:hypothetical protein VTK73DRAFT_5651 [Phialemonium thermophilum]|uniref:Uncharacterized protein n=1 Tax=Phialemonium thermophilum TaxID=223376 RepID=A0ABR3V0Y5_9PEZI
MRRASWVDSQARRRASRGWVLTGGAAGAEDGFEADADKDDDGLRPERRRSWTPGAEGADCCWGTAVQLLGTYHDGARSTEGARDEHPPMFSTMLS